MHLTVGEKAIRCQGQSSSKFSFLEVPASSLLEKNYTDPCAYPPIQPFNPLFRRGCEGAETQQHQAHRTHRAELGKASWKRQDHCARWGGHPPSRKLPHLFKNWGPEKQTSNGCSRNKCNGSINSTTSISLHFFLIEYANLKTAFAEFCVFCLVNVMSRH